MECVICLNYLKEPGETPNMAEPRPKRAKREGSAESPETTDRTKQLCSAPCGHVFHRICISDWLDRGDKSCPSCRKPITKKGLKPVYLSDEQDQKTCVELHQQIADLKKKEVEKERELTTANQLRDTKTQEVRGLLKTLGDETMRIRRMEEEKGKQEKAIKVYKEQVETLLIKQNADVAAQTAKDAEHEAQMAKLRKEAVSYKDLVNQVNRDKDVVINKQKQQIDAANAKLKEMEKETKRLEETGAGMLATERKLNEEKIAELTNKLRRVEEEKGKLEQDKTDRDNQLKAEKGRVEELVEEQNRLNKRLVDGETKLKKALKDKKQMNLERAEAVEENMRLQERVVAEQEKAAESGRDLEELQERHGLLTQDNEELRAEAARNRGVIMELQNQLVTEQGKGIEIKEQLEELQQRQNLLTNDYKELSAKNERYRENEILLKGQLASLQIGGGRRITIAHNASFAEEQLPET